MRRSLWITYRIISPTAKRISSWIQIQFDLTLVRPKIKALVPERPGQRALAGVETKQNVFQIPCEMQHGLDLLRLDYTKERKSEKTP